MITKITILSSGNIAPNKTIDLGKQYESVGDIIQFDIPSMYHGYHYYLAFYMKKHDTILLPVNYVNGVLQFVITSAVTRNSGTYEMIFLATESAVIDGNINDARKVFVSTTMYGKVEDNFLEDPVVDEDMDPNLQIIYDELLDLRDTIIGDIESDYYRGAAYIPDVDDNGVISFTRSDGKDINIPEPKNITGPQGKQGPYYIPSTQDGVIEWTGSQADMEEVESADLKGLISEASETYLDANLHVQINAAVDEKFKYVWDKDKQILYISARENDSDSDNLPPSQVEQILDKVETLEEGLSTIPERAIKIVDKLPETNIESNVIYGVETGLRCEAYTYFYGLKVPVLKFENLEENFAKLQEKFAEVAEEKNLTENDFELLASALTSGYVPIEIDFNTAIIMNYFDVNSKKYIFNVSDLYKKEFNDVNELSDYLLSGQYAQDMIDHNEGNGALERVSLLNRLGMKYSNEELTNDDIGVSYILHPDHYEYYIYNNKEWKSLNSIETVDSLPTENIKVNTIYSLKKTNYEGYFYILGHKIPELRVENTDSSIETVTTLLSNQGFSSEEIDEIMTALSCSLIPINVPEYGMNIFDKNSQKYICRYQPGNIYKEFDTIKEMKNYFIMGQFISDLRTSDIGESSVNDIASGIELLKSRLEFNYTNSSPITMSAVVYEEKPEDASYEYFIYDGEKWIELGKGGIPSISIIVSTGSNNEHPITDEDLETIINNDVVVANASFNTDVEGLELSYKLFKTASVKYQEANEIVMSTITNYFGSAMKRPVYLKLIVNLITKTYTVGTEDFISAIGLNINQIYAEDGFGEPVGSSIYVSTINGESIVGSADNNVTTSIKLENKTVSNWASDATYADYPYRATITESAITSAMVAEVIYGLTEAESGNYAPICSTFNGGIHIYSKVNTSIVIPTILVVK